MTIPAKILHYYSVVLPVHPNTKIEDFLPLYLMSAHIPNAFAFDSRNEKMYKYFTLGYINANCI
jgi:hypothetical protein